MKRLAALCLALSLAVSCQLPFDQPSSPEPYITRAQAELNGRGFTFFHVASFGLLRDRQYLQNVRNGARVDDLPAQLAQLLAAGAEQDTLVAVGGACAEKSRLILEQALELLSGRALPKLELLFLGDARHGRAVAPKLHALSARYKTVEITVD